MYKKVQEKIAPRLFGGALVAAKSEGHAAVERNVLRNAGFGYVQVIPKGVNLALHLVENLKKKDKATEVILCQVELADMSSEEFIELLSLHPLLLSQPIIAVAGDELEKANFEAHGFTEILIRPITSRDLDTALLKSYKFEQAEKAEIAEVIKNTPGTLSTEEFFEQIKFYQKRTAIKAGMSEDMTAEQALAIGISFLREGNLDKAIGLLSKATVERQTAAQAFTALVTAYSKKGNTELVEKNLRDAIRAYADLGQKDKVLDLTRRYNARYPQATNPICEDFERYIKGAREASFMDFLLLLSEIYPIEEEKNFFIKTCYSMITPQEALDLAKKISFYLEHSYPWIGKEVLERVEQRFGFAKKEVKQEIVEKNEKKTKKGFFFSSKQKSVNEVENLDEIEEDFEGKARKKKPLVHQKNQKFQKGQKIQKNQVNHTEDEVEELDAFLVTEDNKSKETSYTNFENVNEEWDQQHKVPLFENSHSREKALPNSSGLFWNVMKATALSYKKMNKKRK